MHRQRLYLFIGFIFLSLFPVDVRGQGNKNESEDIPFKIKVFHELHWLMNNPKIQSELQISDEQLVQVGEILADVQSHKIDFVSVARSYFAKPGPDASAKEKQRWKDARDAAFEELFGHQAVGYDKLKDVLLPHQILRIQQIVRQADLMRQGGKGFVGILAAPSKLKDEVGLTDQECKEFQVRLKEIEARYTRQLADLRAKTYQKALDELDDEQRNKMDKLIGAPFDFDESKRIISRADLEKILKQRNLPMDELDRAECSSDK